MERFRFDSASPRDYPARRLGSEQAEAVVLPSAALSPSPESVPMPPRERIAETGLARGFVISQHSIYPQYDVTEGFHRGTLFVSLDKPLKGVGRCDAN